MSNYWDNCFLQHIKNIDDVKYICEVGARYGDESLILSNIFKNAKLLSFECNPNTINICKTKLSNHKNIKFFDYGLGCIETEIPFFSFINNNDGASSFFKRIDFNETQIENGNMKIKKLSSILENENISYVNILCMDVQGYELNVLKGCESYLSKIQYIIMEEPKQIINTEYLPENIYSKYIGAPSSDDIKKFMTINNFIEIERIEENKIEDNVMYKNTLFINIQNINMQNINMQNINMQKIYGISYASGNFKNRYEVIDKLGNECRFFNEFKCFNETDIDNDFKEKYKEVWNMSQRGGGYWIWKPYIISKMLEQINDNDIIVYIDSGCHINITPESKIRFNDYIEMINNSNSGLLRFQLTHLEQNFTNKNTIEYFKNKFNINNIKMDEYLDNFQLVGGIQIIRKTQFTINFFNKVLEILNDDMNLFTDKYTLHNEKHRHDQSIMSLLYKCINGDLVIDDETCFEEGFDSEKAKQYPFWATRKSS